MRFDCVICDFDGTFTLAEEEGAPFLAAYRTSLARRLGRDLEAAWREAESVVRAHPNEYGWLFKGKLVAPGNADPYIRANTVARMLLDRFGALPDPVERDDVLGELYIESYEHSATVFRRDARHVLERLLASGLPVWVVTNSDTALVRHKIERLMVGAEQLPGVRGNAMKAVIAEPARKDDVFARLPQSQALPGLERPVYLRRGRYYEALREIWDQTQTAPERTLLVGDIYELDLAMPLQLGVAVHLVLKATTPDYERRFVHALDPQAVSDGLEAILGRVGID